MVKAKCFKCGASAIDDTFEQARQKLDHSVGLSRGIKCGDNYGKVKEEGSRKSQSIQPTIQKDTIKTETPKEEPKTEILSKEEQPKTEKKSKKSKSKKEKYL